MVEIEHKFLLKNEQWREQVEKKELFQQAYITTTKGTTVRLRIVGESGYLTLKGKPSGVKAITRSEFEYLIPRQDAEAMIEEFADSTIVKKYRYFVSHEGKTWEIDEFLGDNTGLIVAEVEMDTEDEDFKLPEWVGKCVSDDRRYTNIYLADHPYNTW